MNIQFWLKKPGVTPIEAGSFANMRNQVVNTLV
jgi:hypothetical protein